MRVLFCGGSPKSGSWAMRGVQIAATNNEWSAVSDPTTYDIADADIVVVVKRFNADLIKKIKEAGKPLVLDILDFWQQNGAKIPDNLPDAMMLVKNHIAKINPDMIIAANDCMERDLLGCASVVKYIPHHHRLDAKQVSGGDMVYYDGCINHAKKWLKILEKYAPVKIGIPQDDAAAVFSARDGQNWLPNRWKSNVKAANAIAYGLPLITQAECGALSSAADCYVYSTEAELADAVLNIKKPNYSYDAKRLCGIDSVSKQYERALRAIL